MRKRERLALVGVGILLGFSASMGCASVMRPPALMTLETRLMTAGERGAAAKELYHQTMASMAGLRDAAAVDETADHYLQKLMEILQ